MHDPPSPGEILRDLHFVVDVDTCKRIIDGDVRIDETIADGLSKMFVTSKEAWLNMQRDFDRANAEIEEVKISDEEHAMVIRLRQILKESPGIKGKARAIKLIRECFENKLAERNAN